MIPSNHFPLHHASSLARACPTISIMGECGHRSKTKPSSVLRLITCAGVPLCAHCYLFYIGGVLGAGGNIFLWCELERAASEKDCKGEFDLGVKYGNSMV